MRGLSIAAFIVTVSISLLGLFQLSRLWNSKRPVHKWTSTALFWITTIILLIAYLAPLFITVFACLGIRLGFESQLLLKLSWLNGLTSQAVFLWRRYPILHVFPASRRIRLFVPIMAAITGLLQVVGFIVHHRNNNIGRYVPSSGGCLFHLFSAAAFGYLLRFKCIRHWKLGLFTLAFILAAFAFLLLLLKDGDEFLLANCLLECCVNLVLLIPVPLQDMGSASASSSLTSFHLYTNEPEPNNVNGSSLVINVQPTPPTPPPSLDGSDLSVLDVRQSWHQYGHTSVEMKQTSKLAANTEKIWDDFQKEALKKEDLRV